MAKDFNIRVAVGDGDGRHSTVWRVFTSHDDVYAAHRSMGGVEKLSFHASRICRRAFTAEHQLPASIPDRVLRRWNRAATQPAGGGQGVALLTAIFPEGHLSPNLPKTTKKTTWLPSPMPGEARCVQLLLTQEKKEHVRNLLQLQNQLLVAYHDLPNSEALVIRSWANQFEQQDLIMEVSHGVMRDLVLPSHFEIGVERSVGLTIYSQPDEMRCIELSGYWVPAGEARRRFPGAATLSRNEVIQRTGNLGSTTLD